MAEVHKVLTCRPAAEGFLKCKCDAAIFLREGLTGMDPFHSINSNDSEFGVIIGQSLLSSFC